MNLSYEQFRSVDLSDPFFDSLKEDYTEFVEWFNRKSTEYAYVGRSGNARVSVEISGSRATHSTTPFSF